MRSFSLLILTSIFICSGSAIAQDFREGYIIKLNGDSTSGFIAYPFTVSQSQTCVFKSAKRSKRQKFNSNELKSYGIFNDRKYEAIELPKLNDKVFAEILVKGNTSLYLFQGVFYVLNDSIIRLPPPRDKIVEVDQKKYVKSDKQYVSILNQLIGKCNLTANQTRYHQQDLTSLIQNFNRCNFNEGLIYKQKIPWTKLNYHVFSGVSNSTFEVEGYDENTFSENKSVFIGGGLEISSPRIYDKIFVSLDAIYAKNNFQGYVELQPQGATVRSDIFISTDYIKLPMGAKFIFLNDLSTPYIKGGFVLGTSLNGEISSILETEQNGLVTTAYDTEKIENTIHTGYWFGVGYYHTISGRVKAFIEYRYESLKTSEGFYSNLRTQTISNSLIIGIRF